MEAYQWLCLFGVPTVSATIIGVFASLLSKTVKEQKALKVDLDSKNKAMEKGVQALLRSQLIDNYNHYKKKGKAPIYAKDNFTNLYEQYEALGENGVMQHIYDEFMNLPTGE